MTQPLNLLFSYSHSPYQINNPQKHALRLKELLTTEQNLDQNIDQIQTSFQQSLLLLQESTPSNKTQLQILQEKLTKISTLAIDYDSDLIELEKKVIFLEKKLKTEKEKTHTEALKILGSFNQRFLTEELKVKAKIAEFHNLITNHQQVLEQKKLHSKTPSLEKKIPLYFLKIKGLEEQKRKCTALFENEILIMEKSLDALSILFENYLQNGSFLPEPPSLPLPEPLTKSLQFSQEKAPPIRTHHEAKAKPSIQAKTASQRKTKESDDVILAQYALAASKLEIPVKKERKKETPQLELTFHKDEVFKMLHTSLKDCLSNPLSIFSLKEKYSDSEEFSSKPSRELISEVKTNLQTAKQCYFFLKSLEKENREIYLINNVTKMQIPIDQILAIPTGS